MFTFDILFWSFGQSFEDTAQLVATRLQAADDVLHRRLQQGDDVGDEVVLRLDVAQGVEHIVADIAAFLDEGTLQDRTVAGLTETLNQLGGSIAGLAKHQRC